MEKTEVVGCFAKQIYPAGISDDPTVWTVSVFELKEVVKTPSGELKTRITVAGSGVPKSKKLTYKLVGEWRTHPVYEEQFALETYEEVVSKTKFGIISYLASGQIKGIGRTLAERTFNMFGEQTLEVLDAIHRGS